jgi:hypothetical protein
MKILASGLPMQAHKSAGSYEHLESLPFIYLFMSKYQQMSDRMLMYSGSQRQKCVSVDQTETKGGGGH